ncbi:MAG: hypothetical protein ACIALR_11960, partial [Blastopirellula sp. JB062]
MPDFGEDARRSKQASHHRFAERIKPNAYIRRASISTADPCDSLAKSSLLNALSKVQSKECQESSYALGGWRRNHSWQDHYIPAYAKQQRRFRSLSSSLRALSPVK